MNLIVNSTVIPDSCPWCGEQKDLYTDHYGPQIDLGSMFWVACGACGCCGPKVYSNAPLDAPGTLSDIVDEAIAEWNSRKVG